MVTKDTKTYLSIARILFTAIFCVSVLAMIEVIATIVILWFASPILKTGGTRQIGPTPRSTQIVTGRQQKLQ